MITAVVESHNLAPLIALPFLFLLSSFAASSETSFFSLDRFQLKRLKDKDKPSYDRIKRLLDHPTRLLIIILMINEAANLSIANVVSRVVESYHGSLTNIAGGFGLSQRLQVGLISAISLFVAAPLTVVFGEITPKVIASRMNKVVASLNSRLLILLYRTLYPLLWLLDAIVTTALKSLGAKGKGHLSKFVNPLDEADFVELMEEAHREGSLEPAEKKLIQKVFRLDDTPCSLIMTPIAEAFMLSEKSKIPEVMKEIQEQKYSRIPVYSRNRKNIVGILYVKDLLNLRLSKKPGIPMVSDLMTKAMHVSPNMHLSALLRRFKRSKVHLAVVTDKSGHALGLISLEDVLENIFGEIVDERDTK